MKIEMFGKEREITLKDCLIVIGQLFVISVFFESYSYYTEQMNAEGVAKMQAAIPAVVSMDGTQSLPEKIEMVSRTIGFYSGSGQIDERASKEDIIKHYKREFARNGWKYIGRFYWKDAHPHSQADEWYYCFEKGEEYFISLCLTGHAIKYDGRTVIIFQIGLKKDNEELKYCKIEDVEP